MVGRFVAARVEVVLLLREDDDRFRRERGQEVFVIEAQRQRARRALLHVGAELVLHVSPELGDETARGRHGPAIFDTAEPGRHRAAAGVAGDAEVARRPLLCATSGSRARECRPTRATSRSARRRAPAGCRRSCALRCRSRAWASGSRPRTASARPGRSDRRSAPHSRGAPVPDRRIDTSRSPCRCPNVRTRRPHPEAESVRPFGI